MKNWKMAKLYTCFKVEYQEDDWGSMYMEEVPVKRVTHLLPESELLIKPTMRLKKPTYVIKRITTTVTKNRKLKTEISVAYETKSKKGAENVYKTLRANAIRNDHKTEVFFIRNEYK